MGGAVVGRALRRPRGSGRARRRHGEDPLTPPELESLVDRTAGPQPWRRLLHATSGTFAAVVLVLFDVPRSTALVLLAVILGGLSALDLIRLLHRRANVLFFRSFRHLASPREAGGPASSTWYALGLLLSVAFFPTAAAVSGILVLALADPAASYVGRRWGRRPFLGATLEGTLLFAVVAFCIVAPRHGIAVAAATALVTTLAERLSRPLDDNLTLPVVGAATITLLDTVL